MMLRWCDAVIRAASPLVPCDLRRDWMREWRAELAYACGRARRNGRRMPLTCLWRACGAFFHAAWLRWDRWRIEMIWQDLKHALRSLRRKPGFTAVTVLTLAIGIGGTTAIFGAVNAVLLRPLPYPAADALVRVFKTSLKQPDRVGGAVSPPDYTDWRSQGAAFSELAAYDGNSITLTGQGAAEVVRVGRVTGGFFAVLGVTPLYGRAISVTDDPAGSRDVVVLGHGIWSRRFGASPQIIGQRVDLDGVAHEIVGVMPAGVELPLRSELWTPMRFSARELETQRGAHYIEVLGRLKPGVSIEAARADMRSIAARLAEQYPRTNRDSSASVHPLRESLVGSMRQSMFVLLGAVGLVLVIVCVNIAGLVLIRGVSRSRELAVRLAVGAGRFSLFRGLLMESLVLGAAGGAAGLVLAYWASTAISSLDPSIGVPLLNQTRLDLVVVAFAFGVAVFATIFFGTMPAWQATSISDVVSRIRQDAGSTTSDPKRQRTRNVMIVAETVLAVVLLVGAGLLTRSFMRLIAIDLGFEAGQVQTFSISLPAARYGQPQLRQEFIESALARLAARPEVEAVGAITGLPLTNTRFGISTSTLDGVTLSDDEQDRLTLQVRIVTPDYFRALTIPAKQGRVFTAADRMGAEPVAVLNESAARRIWPAESALGHQLEIGTRFGMGGARAGGTIVGVVGDVREFGPALAAPPTLFLAHGQWPVDSMTIAARTRGEPSALIEPARALLRQMDADVPMFAVRSMQQIRDIAVAQPRLYLTLIASFALTAMLLAALGLYGVLAYAVGQRTREIGIRLALGARRGEVLRMVMSQAGKLVVIGVVLGLISAVLASRLLRAQLFEVAPTDLATYVGVALGLMMVSVLASWIPARRASRIDPMRALRND
jgi:putative ABC transport system permease protein